MDSVNGTRSLAVWVPPFGDLRINAYVPLPAAYRSLSRPSSAPDAKAFPLRSFLLDLFPLRQERAIVVNSCSQNYAGSRVSSRNCSVP